ncbi:MAG TPA: AraC family transcriptional regulator [Noviherbaspirillum sp.]|nr:AraC family transcriptional regulator [Noviherbaspirillum sp.]
MNDKTPWHSVDPLGEALHFLRMSGVFYCRSEFSAPWGLALPSMPDCLMFHVVNSGRCWLQATEEPALLLQPGDFVLVAHGAGHRLLSEPHAKAQDLFTLPREEVSDRFEILRHGGGGAGTQLICGAVRFDHPAARRLVALLPPVLAIDGGSLADAGWMQATLRLMAAEAGSLRPGGEAVITRLADILVIQAIRSWLAKAPGAQSGWLGALQDRQIGRALALIHREPGREWTLAGLAGEVAMSRSAFAARFAELVGVPSMQYLAHWRMQLAQGWLQESDAGVAELAARLGYRSEAAFCRAFKRVTGMAPGVARRGGEDAGVDR